MFTILSTLKIFHLLFVFVWVGNLLCLTRFLGYMAQESKQIQERMGVYLKRMAFFVGIPSLILAVACGVWLFLLKGTDFRAAWFHSKMTFFILLVICEQVAIRKLKRGNYGQPLQYKILHGVTSLFLIGLLWSVYFLKGMGS